MQNAELEDRLLELRLKEMELQEQIIECVREAHRRELWKERGHRSIQEFCERELGYDTMDTREILVAIGVILTSEALVSPDPRTQARIESLRQWRRQRAKTAGVAAFRLLPNRTLMGIAEANPTSTEQLREIHGMGPKKIEALGPEILAALQPLWPH